MGKKVDNEELRQSLNDPNFKGESYEVEEALLEGGPLRNRKCTDCLFLVLFLAFAGAMGYVSMFAYKNGKPEELLSPVDYDGMLCGVNYTDYPSLYYLV